MRRVSLAVVLGLLAGPAVAATTAAGAAPTCSGPAPQVRVGRHVATGAIRVDAAAAGWSCTGGVTPGLQLRVAPTNLLAALLVPGSTAAGGAGVGYEVPGSIQSSLLLRPPACFTATLTVTAPGVLQTRSGQGCG